MSKLTLRVVHLSSVHPRNDTRIFFKMCKSLVLNGYNVSQVIADGNGDELKDGVSIIDVGGIDAGGRLLRIIKTCARVFEKAKKLDGDIYHIHDPELISAGLKLKKLGKKVIFDSHEDIPKQILSKIYLNKILRIILSKILEWYEYWSLPKFDYLIAATPFIRDKLLKINPNTVNINNFPSLNESKILSQTQKENTVAYIGVISEIRGIKQVISALSYTQNVRLNLAGSFSDKIFEEKIKKNENWSKVNRLGFLNRREVSEILAKSNVGIVTLLASPNHIHALPNKMFEYMSAGLPVIASNFSLWREIIEGNQCGICVDPLNPKVIGDAIQYLMDNPQKAEQMGKNGRKAVEQKYNWLTEEKKLLTLYKNLLQ
jgi:glycosyltransferase involved in cell wall biosynthesis